MAEHPRMDTSRPSGLRFAGFLLAVAGAALIGYGAVQTWVTVGIRSVQTNTDTAIVGIDLTDGTVALACAVVLLVSVLGTRMPHARSVRMALGGLAIASAAIAVATAGAFLQNGIERTVVVDAIGIPRNRWEELEVFREYGLGPYLVLAGGVLGFFAGVLTLAWAHRLQPAPAPGDPRG